MATKFIQNIVNSKSTLANRASLIEKQATVAQQNMINELEMKKMNIESQIQTILDFAPDSTYSLKPGRPNFAAPAFTKELHQLKMSLKLTIEELEVATATYDELFVEVAE